MLGLEEGSLPRRVAHLAVPRRRRAPRARRPARAPRPGQPRPLPLLHRVHARRRGGCTSCARRRPTTARRASRARSGRRSRPSSTATTSRARRRGGRSPRSRGRSRRRRPSASGCARSRCSRRRDARRGASRSPTRTAGSGGSRARGSRVRPRDAPARTRRCSRGSARKTTFGVTELERFADCSSAWLFERVISPKTIDAEVDAMLRGSVAHSALHKFYAGLPKELGADRVTPENVEQARRLPAPLPRRRAARRRPPRARPTLQAAELEESLWRDLEGFVRDEARSPLAARAAPVRGRRSAPTARRPSCSAASQLGDGLLPERQDRPHRRRPVQRARDRAGLQVGPERALGEADRRGAEAPDPALHARAARPRRHRAARRRLPRARRRPRRRAGCCTPARPTTCPGFQRNDYLDDDDVLGARRDRARARARATRSASARATCATTRRAARARRGATSGRCAGWSDA